MGSMSTSVEQKSEGARLSRPSVEPGQLFIEGKWREGTGGKRRDVIDPSTGRVITTVAEAGDANLNDAIAAARKAFDEGPWPRLSGRERGHVLHRVAQYIRDHADDLMKIESIDAGHPVALSRPIDVGTVIDMFDYYAGLAQMIEGTTRNIPAPAMAYTRREPIGVVGAITPFNFPLILSSTKIAPALAAGNTVVQKPASETPLSALWMAQALTQAGVPEGVFNVITGPGSSIGEAIVRHPCVDKIAFTGSTDVGRRIAQIAGENLKPVTLELGGKSAHIIFEDADLEKAIPAAILGFTLNSGQFCMAGTRLLVARPLLETVLQALAQAVSHVPLGDAFDPSTVIGPLISEKQIQTTENYVRIAREEEKARIVCGGQRVNNGDGFFYLPTVVAGVADHSRLVQEEIFGPVVTVQPFDTEEEAVRLANSTVFGLAAGLHTRDVSRVHRLAAQLQAGMVWVNTYGILDPAIPYGGCKQSGYGREYGPEVLNYYTQTKSVIVAL